MSDVRSPIHRGGAETRRGEKARQGAKAVDSPWNDEEGQVERGDGFALPGIAEGKCGKCGLGRINYFSNADIYSIDV
jgi:hypothetical protein